MGVSIQLIHLSSSRKLGFEQDDSYFRQNRGGKTAHSLPRAAEALAEEQATQGFEQRRVGGKEHHNIHKFNSENYLKR